MRTPAIGDIWEFQLPGKRKVRKQIASIGKQFGCMENYIHWKRLPKGRYTGIRESKLIQFGKRISTKSERDEADMRWINNHPDFMKD